MNRSKMFHWRLAAVGIVWLVPVVFGQTTIIRDDYNASGRGTGFLLNQGINSGIHPPATRLTGSAPAGLRYLYTQGSPPKTTAAYTLGDNKLVVAAAPNSGRFTLSADGSTPFNFADALGVNTATPAHQVVYDISLKMMNRLSGTPRFSFGLGTQETTVDNQDFCLQLWRTNSTATRYWLQKRIDSGSSGVADLNRPIIRLAADTYGTEISLLIRVTDAGAESGANYHSRVQVSLDGGGTWIYDTRTDGDLPHGWRLDGAARYFIWDQAGTSGAGVVAYDDFQVIRHDPFTAAPLAPEAGAANLGPTVNLSVTVSNTAPGDLTVTFYGREAPRPFPGPDFCLVVLPDTQNYAREASAQGQAVKEMWFTQTEWIVTNRVAHNIVYVAHLGDIVQNGDIKGGKPNTTEWRHATNAMYRLENAARTLLPDGIPYGLAVGNHDQTPANDPDGTTTLYNQYFGWDHFHDRPWYGGYFGQNNDSHCDLFSVGGLDFIVLYFEYGRHGSAILNWANGVLAAHPHRRAMVVTHSAGSDTTPSNLSAQGSAIYNALKSHTNFFLMLGGHVFKNGGEGSRVNTFEGRAVRTFISNYQGRMNGGNGYLRLMYFSPSNHTVRIRTYSPWLDRYETDADSEMTFGYNLQLPDGPGSPGTPYVALAINTGVLPGNVTTCAWSGLQAKQAYDWYVEVTDAGGHRMVMDPRRFTTKTKFSGNTPPVGHGGLVTVPDDAPTSLTFEGSDADEDPLTFQIISQPLGGLIADFNPVTGSVTYLPARGYRGPDRIIFAAHDGTTNSAPAILNLIVTAAPDADGNGLPDAWEALYGITDPDDDADGDGQSNLAEYRANTNPTNAASALRLTEVVRQLNGDVEITWSSVGGTRYRVQYTDALDGRAMVDVLRTLSEEMDTGPYGEESTQTFTDTTLPAGSARYYRIQVVP